MSKPVIALVLGLIFASPSMAAEPAAAAPVKGEDIQKTMVQFRNDLQALETEVVSKSISLSADEATAFWPVFKRFQAEQKKIIDGQIAGVRTYADRFGALSDDDATAYVNSLLARDQQIHDLRQKYLGEYAKVIGKRKAARVIHLSRKLGLASQARLAEVIPLVR